MRLLMLLCILFEIYYFNIIYEDEKEADGTFSGEPHFHLIYSAEYLRKTT